MKEERLGRRTTIDCSGDGLTQQNFKPICDVNTIVDKARRQGIVTHVNSRIPRYADCTSIPDYATAVQIVHTAETEFMKLPAKVRERFNNDPQKLVEFISDSKNYDEAVKLNLVEPKVVDKKEVVSPKVVDEKKEK